MKFLSMEFEIPLVCFIFLLFLLIIFYSKKRVNLIENKMYEVILITSLVASGFDTIVHILSALTPYEKLCTDYYFIVDFINKIVGTSFVVIFTCLTCYVLLISYRKLRENPSILWKIIIAISAVFFLVINFFHVTITESEFARNTTGVPIIVPYIVVAINLVFAMFLSIKNFDRNDKRYYTIFLITIMLVVLYVLSLLFRGLIIYDLILALLCYIMYFTLENPDIQMINLLVRNKELTEQSVNDKSNFLFKVSQELKNPLKNVISNIKLYKESSETDTKEEIINKIERDANNAYFIINDITSISSADVKKIKMQDNKYKTEKLFKELEVNAKNKLSVTKKSDDIEFNFKVLNSYPEYLCGDNIKLKQILLSIISNSIKYTKKGFIDVEVDIVSRYDICRLIFTIKDSGCGMSIAKVNDLLSVNVDIDEIDFQNNDNLALDIPMITKIIKLLGGSLSIKSEENKGTIVVIVIDQKIENIEEDYMKKAKEYNVIAQKKQRVLLADDTPNLDKMERLVSKYDVDIVTTLVGKDVIDKVKSGDNYNLIIIRDEIKPDNAFTILKELQKNKKFKTPVIIGISKEKEFIKDHFIEDGFSDYIMLENIDNEIERICDKYI